jgi:ferredoxin
VGHKVKVGAVELDITDGANLSEEVNITNCPILFGCRTGICGTCLVNVKDGADKITPAGSDELEFLDIVGGPHENPRLACMFKVLGDVELEYIGK